MCMCVRWQCTKSHACHAKATAERWRPNDARAYIRPLAVHQVPRLPCKSHRQSGGDQGTPGRTSDSLAVHQVPRLRRKTHRQSGGYQGTPGRTSDPLHCTKSHACHAKATGRAAETKGRQGVHPTPCSAPSPTPAMQKPPAERRRPRDARVYIRPLAVHQVPNLPRKSHQQSGGDQGTPGRTSDSLQCSKCRACHAKATGRAAKTKGRQGVHLTPCREPSAAPATQNQPAERRRPRDARAYIRPLAMHQVPHLPRKTHRQSGGDQGTPGAYIRPLGGAPSAAPATQKPSAERRRPRDARAYIQPLAVHQVSESE